MPSQSTQRQPILSLWNHQSHCTCLHPCPIQLQPHPSQRAYSMASRSLCPCRPACEQQNAGKRQGKKAKEGEKGWWHALTAPGGVCCPWPPPLQQARATMAPAYRRAAFRVAGAKGLAGAAVKHYNGCLGPPTQHVCLEVLMHS